jgi:hypothetical protein
MYRSPLTFIRCATVVLCILLGTSAAATAAPNLQATVDIKALTLTTGDLPRGFAEVKDRTVAEERPDGAAVYDVTYARERTAENLAAYAFEVRSGVARTAQVEDAVLQLESTKEAFLGEGWATTGVPPLGDEALGLTQTTDGEGGKVVHHSYVFRKGAYILMVGIRGRPEATKLDDAVSLAIKVSGRLDTALRGGAPAPATSRPATAPLPMAPPVPPLPQPRALSVQDLDGNATLVASDGTFLGSISSNAFDAKSVCNDFGQYGNPFSSLSIKNEFGTYGNPFSSSSPYNEFTSTPPIIMYRGRPVGHLTKNEFLPGAVDPDGLLAVLGCPKV